MAGLVEVGGFWRGLGVALVGLAACGPVTYTTTIGGAAEAVAAAKAADAPKFAPYEYYFAEANLAKAREEVASAEYEDAIRFAKAAHSFGIKARELAQARSLAAASAAGSSVPTAEALGVGAPR